MDRAVGHIASSYAPKGNYIGILMRASLFVEAWDFYSIAFVLVFIREHFAPPPLLLGLTAAAVQGGADVGAVLGGWLTDKLGRRLMLMASIVMFIVLALAQSFAPSVAMLALIRFLLGIPLGADVTTGFTYIMEYLPKGRRDVMGNRWQVMFAAGKMVCAVVVAISFGRRIEQFELTRIGFRTLLERRAADYIQPDLCAAGGLSECKKIADMALAYGVRFQNLI